MLAEKSELSAVQYDRLTAALRARILQRGEFLTAELRRQ
jgi:hypothetical protein